MGSIQEKPFFCEPYCFPTGGCYHTFSPRVNGENVPYASMVLKPRIT